MKLNRSTFLLLVGSIAASGCGGTNGGGTPGTGGTGGTACNDNVGTPGDCGPVTTCWSWASSLCNSAKTMMKPEVAQSAVSCMLACKVDPYTCIGNALAAACSDSGANADCTKYVLDCGSSSAPITDQQCHAMLDGFTASGRSTLASTMGNDCNRGFGLWSAIESL